MYLPKCMKNKRVTGVIHNMSKQNGNKSGIVKQSLLRHLLQ